MRKKYNNLLSIIIPNKKINIFVLSIIIIGVTLGAIFSNIIDINNQNLVIEKINSFINNINNGSINSLLIFKNALGINLLYTILIWLLGMSLIGIIIVFIILFFKSFVLGFTLSSFIITYKYKGIILSILHLLFGELLNIIALLLLTIYSINFTIKLLKQIFKTNINNNELKHFLKHYFIILIIVLIINITSSLTEAFILPSLIKLIIGLYT